MDSKRRQILLQEVSEIEKRLGTDKERPDDFKRCAFLVHEFNAFLTRIHCEKTLAQLRSEAIASSG